MSVTVVLRSRPLPDDHPLAHALDRRESPSAVSGDRHRLSRVELETILTPEDGVVALLEEFARGHGLSVVRTDGARHDVVLEGDARAFAAAFGVELEEFDHPRGSFRAHRGDVHLPPRLADQIEGILGLDAAPVAGHAAAPGVTVGAAPYTPRDLARAYGFPQATGRGERIAILAFGGGYDPADLAHYFGTVLDVPCPKLTDVSVLGARNATLGRSVLGPIVAALDGGEVSVPQLVEKYGQAAVMSAMFMMETTMDIQVAGGVSPDAELTVVFAPDEPRGFYEAIYTALGLGSGAGDEREPLDVPTALSLSWGMSESRWAGLRMGAVDAALRTARLLGATVCCSSGDYGAANAAWGATEASVNFPASSPHVLACGGTTLTPGAAAGAPGEVAWNAPFHGTPMATGGGVSGFFPRPGYQHDVVATEDGSSHEPTWVSPHVADAAHFVGRGVPDVAAHADPAVGYRLVLGGVEFTAGGTSAATPLWAGLVALLAERLGRPVGWLNGLLYDERGRRALRDIVSGDNDITGGKVAAYRARRGWDACTGLGTPDGEALLAALQSADSSPAR